MNRQQQRFNEFGTYDICKEAGVQWLSGRVLHLRQTGRRFEPHRRHWVVSLSKNINPSLVLVQPRNTCAFITEILLMGRKESNQTNKKSKEAKIRNRYNRTKPDPGHHREKWQTQ